MSRKIKIIKKNPEPAKGTNVDPGQLGQYSAKYNVNESSALNQYLSSRGINPKFVSKDTKISYSKSKEFLAWKRNHMFESITTGRDIGTDTETRSVDAHSPTRQRAEILKKSMQHYKITTPPGSLKKENAENEKRIEKKVDKVLKVVKAEGSQTPQLTPEEVKKSKMTALDKFRRASAEREKKHAEIEKKSGGMKGAIDRLSAHMNKEEVEQIDELNYDTVKSLYTKRRIIRDEPSKKSKEVKVKNVSTSISRLAGHKTTQNQPFDKVDRGTHYELVPKKEEVEQIDELNKDTLKSYRDKSMSSIKNARKNRDAAEPGKDMSKGFADLYAKSDAIAKKRAKGLAGYLQRKHGMKPGYSDERKTTSEDVGDAKAAVNADGLPNPQLEPVSEKKKQMSKSARMIKALYKSKRMVKEDLYDHEKEDKSVATYGKKPKFDKADNKDSEGETKPSAAAIMTGGTTLTGQNRDDVEIDPMMRNRPGQPDVTKKDGKKKDGKKEEKK